MLQWIQSSSGESCKYLLVFRLLYEFAGLLWVSVYISITYSPHKIVYSNHTCNICMHCVASWRKLYAFSIFHSTGNWHFISARIACSTLIHAFANIRFPFPAQAVSRPHTSSLYTYMCIWKLFGKADFAFRFICLLALIVLYISI